jgi:hypothetical protein
MGGEAMNREEVRKLLGGYATGTLTQAEQEALFAAALEDQELFDALAAEQPVRDLLRDPAVKAGLLAALDDGPAKQPWWRWRPLIAGVAVAGIAAVAVVAWKASQPKPAPIVVAELREGKRPVAPASPESSPTREAREQVSGTRARGSAVGDQAAVSRRATENLRDAASQRPKLPAGVGGVVGGLIGAGASGDSIPTPPPPPPPITTEPPVPAERKPLEIPLPQSAPVMAFQEKDQVGNKFAGPILPPAVAPPPAPANGASSNNIRLQQAQGLSPSAQQSQVVVERMTMAAGKAATVPLRIVVLRGDREAPLGVSLNAGETVRLRVVPPVDGELVVTEGGKTVLTASVKSGVHYDSPPLPFQGAGSRELRLEFRFSGVSRTDPPSFSTTLVLSYR